MSSKGLDLPERLRAGGGTDLERRLMNALANDQTPPEVLERVAHGLGVSPVGLGAAASGTALSTGATATKAAAAAGMGTVPWLSAGLIGLAVAGGIVGTRAWKTSTRQQPTLTAVVIAPTSSAGAASAPAPAAAPSPAKAVAVAVVEPLPSASVPRASRPLRTGSPVTDLRDETALVDAARAAVSSGAANHALEIVRKYEEKYPAGNIRPEAAAIKIEALAKLGRSSEARTLAQRFKADYGPGPLSERVVRIAGVTQPK